MDTPSPSDRPLDPLRIVAMARQHRSDALGELIAVGSRRLFFAATRKLDQLLHRLLMSPASRDKAIPLH